LPRDRVGAMMAAMKKPFVALLLLIALATMLAGCGTPAVSVGLKIELVRVVVAADGSAQVNWRVVNPNIVPYLLAKGSHRISLNGVPVGTVNANDALGIPAQQTAEGTNPLIVEGGAAKQALESALAAGSAKYKVESTLTVRIYDEVIDKSKLLNSGTVPVTAK